MFSNTKLRLAFLALPAILAVAPLNAGILYTQPYDGSTNLIASQNDTGGFGNFATVYDNFTLAGGGTISNVEFTGGYFNPPSQGTITGWTVNFYSDNAGQPGALVGTDSLAGTGGETFLTNAGGFPIYTYSINLGTSFIASSGTQYWLSVVPDLGFPPQWGWSSGTGGDAASYQDFFGARSQQGFDMAFTLNGTSATPEPVSFLLAGSALALLVSVRRRFV